VVARVGSLMPTAAEAGLAACLECGLMSPLKTESPCPRCGAAVRSRRADAVGRTIALSMAAAICYVPANVLPVLVTRTPNGTEADTIIDGIFLLYQSGSWFLALIVLVASVMIPIGKIAVLCVLCVVVIFRTRVDPHDCTRLFRIVAFIGRWSMLDVFVVAILVSLVQLQLVATVTPEKGALAFGAVVVLTMLATMSFDPRLIWDASEREFYRG
jgi:paraquat-inducible protein A